MIRRTNRVIQHCKDMRGFTLIELMIAVAIISILMTTGFYSMIDSRRKTQDIVAMAEANSLGKTVLNALVDEADINFVHLPGDGSAFGGEDTSGSARQPIFFFSNGVKADITGNTKFYPSGKAFFEADVWYANSSKKFYLLIDEKNGINTFPEY
ncbi:MAG: type II secretion system protein [Desulfobacterales bacterium]|nr:type II secretion system protein [Desulfobacterales bacterium]